MPWLTMAVLGLFLPMAFAIFVIRGLPRISKTLEDILIEAAA